MFSSPIRCLKTAWQPVHAARVSFNAVRTPGMSCARAAAEYPMLPAAREMGSKLTDLVEMNGIEPSAS